MKLWHNENGEHRGEMTPAVVMDIAIGLTALVCLLAAWWKA